MKSRYDKKAKRRSFKPEDRVLTLLPVHGSPLKARYCGPYTVQEKCNDFDYIINTPSRRKSKHLCHIKIYHLRDNVVDKPLPLASVAEKVEEEPGMNEEARCMMRLNN